MIDVPVAEDTMTFVDVVILMMEKRENKTTNNKKLKIENLFYPRYFRKKTLGKNQYSDFIYYLFKKLI